MIKTYIISTCDPEKIWELSRNAVSDKDYYQKVVNYLINKSHLGQAQNKANSEIEEHVTELMLSSSLLKQQEYESHTRYFISIRSHLKNLTGVEALEYISQIKRNRASQL